MLYTILDYFENTCRNHADKVAIIEPNNIMSYYELFLYSKNIGYRLSHKIGGVKHRPILAFIDKSAACVATMLGILYSGNCYVPMDIKTPKNRLEHIINTLGEEIVVITTREEYQTLEDMELPISIILYEDLVQSDNDNPSGQDNRQFINDYLSEIRRTIVDTDLMYILFTSGSTGVPKGVAITHRSLVDYIDALLCEIGIEENDVIGCQAPFYADLSLKDLYMPLASGATLCIIPQKFFSTPKKCLQYMEDNGVTFIMWVPTAYRIMYQFKALDKIRPSKLRRFFFSGEAMPVPVYKYWRYHYPEAESYQLYGPTEITGACTYYKVDRTYSDDETIPIGKPFKNTGVLLLDDNERIVTLPDVEGEICIYGSCLAAGYYKDTDKTKEKFVQNPQVDGYQSLMYRTGDMGKYDDNGNLVFISRKDFQVKHAGRRIELGEIEKAAESISGLLGCCCVQNREKDMLVLYCTGDIDNVYIMKSLKTKLPPYMVPQRVEVLDMLPQLSNGKLDRKTLDFMVNEREKHA